MDNNKRPSEPSAAERWVMDETHWRGKNFLDADAIYNEYHGIRKTLLSIQIVQIIQGITLLALAAALLLRLRAKQAKSTMPECQPICQQCSPEVPCADMLRKLHKTPIPDIHRLEQEA